MVTSVNPTGRRVGYNFYFWSNSISINYKSAQFNHLNFVFYVEKLFNKFFKLFKILSKGRFQPRILKFNSNFFGFGNRSFLINLELFDYTWLSKILRTSYKRFKKKNQISRKIFSLLNRYRYFVFCRRKKLLNLKKKYFKYLKLRRKKFLRTRRVWYKWWLKKYRKYKSLRLKLKLLNSVSTFKNSYFVQLVGLYQKLSVLKFRKAFKYSKSLSRIKAKFRRLIRKISMLNRFVLIRNKIFNKLVLPKSSRDFRCFKGYNFKYTRGRINNLCKYKFLKSLFRRKLKGIRRKLVDTFFVKKRNKNLFKKRVLKRFYKKAYRLPRKRLVLQNYTMFKEKARVIRLLNTYKKRYIHYRPKSKSNNIYGFTTDRNVFVMEKLKSRNREMLRSIKLKKSMKTPNKLNLIPLMRRLENSKYRKSVEEGARAILHKEFTWQNYTKLLPALHSQEARDAAIKRGVQHQPISDFGKLFYEKYEKYRPTTVVTEPVQVVTQQSKKVVREKKLKPKKKVFTNAERRLLKFKRIFFKKLKRPKCLILKKIFLKRKSKKSKCFGFFLRYFKGLNLKTSLKGQLVKVRFIVARKNSRLNIGFNKLIKDRLKRNFRNSKSLKFYNKFRNRFKVYLKSLTYYSKNKRFSGGFVRLIKSKLLNKRSNFFKNRFNSWFFLKNFKRLKFTINDDGERKIKSVSELKFNKIRFSINSLLLDKVNALIKLKIKFLSTYIKHGIFNVFNKYFLLFYNFSKNFILEVLIRHGIDIGLTSKFIVNWIKLKFTKGFRVNSIIHGLRVAFKEFPRLAGYKICLSGRFTRKQIATYQWTKKGKVLLTVQNSIIDYGSIKMITRFGVCGIKLWLHNLE